MPLSVVVPGPCCATCRHFFAEQKACRRYPPALVVLPQLTDKGPAMVPAAFFPTVMPETVCGEHRAAEEG